MIATMHVVYTPESILEWNVIFWVMVKTPLKQ